MLQSLGLFASYDPVFTILIIFVTCYGQDFFTTSLDITVYQSALGL